MMLERNNHVELRPTIQQLFDMTQKVARDLITVVQMVPRLALQATPRQLKDLEVSQSCCSDACYLLTPFLLLLCQFLAAHSTVHAVDEPQLSTALLPDHCAGAW